jgi:hypothetical protein
MFGSRTSVAMTLEEPKRFLRCGKSSEPTWPHEPVSKTRGAEDVLNERVARAGATQPHRRTACDQRCIV